MSAQFADWQAVRARVEQIVHESEEPFAPDTVANSIDVISACGGSSPLPSNVQRGYWPTISFGWGAFELEVFSDRVEVYHFKQGVVDVWYEYHQPGESFCQRFLDDLAEARAACESV